MFALLGSALGFFTSFLPSVMDYFNNVERNRHELAMLERRAELQLEHMQVEASVREIETLHEHDLPSGVRFIDGLRASVRPVITYVFFFLFCGVEIAAYSALVVQGVDAGLALNIIWDENIQGLFASIMAFWFGGRLAVKYFK